MIQSPAEFHPKVSILHEQALLTGNRFGEKPQRDEVQRSRGVELNHYKNTGSMSLMTYCL